MVADTCLGFGVSCGTLFKGAGVVIAGFWMRRQQIVRDRDAQMALAANQDLIDSLKRG